MATQLETDGYNTDAFDRGTSPVLRLLTREQVQEVARYKADASLRRRISELATKSNQGELTPQERSEYEGYVRANKFVAVLQAQAQKLLASPDQLK